MSENIIEIIGLTYKNIFNDFSLGIEENKFITIAGPNNCGKTTLLRMLDNQIEINNTFYKTNYIITHYSNLCKRIFQKLVRNF